MYHGKVSLSSLVIHKLFTSECEQLMLDPPYYWKFLFLLNSVAWGVGLASVSTRSKFSFAPVFPMYLDPAFFFSFFSFFHDDSMNNKGNAKSCSHYDAASKKLKKFDVHVSYYT